MSSFYSWSLKTKEQLARKRIIEKREKKRRQDLLKVHNVFLHISLVLNLLLYANKNTCLKIFQLKTAQTGLRRFLEIIN